MSITYKTAYQIYESINLPRNPDKKELFFNIYAKFVSSSVSNSQQNIILEDYSLNCNFHVILTNNYKRFQTFFQPWYIFRFQNLKFITCTNNDENFKKIFFKVTNVNSIVVFNLINKPNSSSFVFSLSSNPSITESDQRIFEQFQEHFISKINSLSISSLNDEFKKKGKNTNSINVSFLAQLIEIKKINSNTILLKCWDGSVPKFKVKHPINQATAGICLTDLDKMHVECDLDLHNKANGKLIFVLIYGQDHVLKFKGKKPKNYVLFYNAQMTKSSSNVLIELRSDINLMNKSYIEFFEYNTNLGQLLIKKIGSNQSLDVAKACGSADESFDQDSFRNEIPINQLNTLPINENSIRLVNDLIDESNENYFTSQWSNESLLNSNFLNNTPVNEQNITPVNDFTTINESNRDYEVHCSIVDLFPLNHKAFDLIRMKCSLCNLDETVYILFRSDLKGLMKATSVFYTQYQKNSEIQCPDATGIQDENHRMFAILNGSEAEIYLNLNPIKVIANDNDEQYNLMRKIDFLKEQFKDHRDLVEEYQNCHMLIRPDVENDLYKIKTIFINI